ncbi:hypothetical protein [Gracilibacillus saliphilus]|uniref:hypothetical protein n=1 Tax=Gracilibacillus saliphilus TaxID=543890 RepID=UPI0013D1FC70|nr:hypothetical protein [Gracilibacillus saliphilus]
MFLELTIDNVKFEPILIKIDQIISIERDYDGEEQIRVIETTKGTYRVKESYAKIKELLMEQGIDTPVNL